MPRPLAPALLGVLAALLAPLLLVAPAQGTDVTAARGPGFHLPRVGSCHQLTQAEAGAMSDPDRAVPCRKRHTSLTTGVLRLKGRVDWSSQALVYRANRGCLRKQLSALDATQKREALSAYTFFYFYPTKAERRRGAAWIRCDLGLNNGLGNPRAALPDDPAATLKGKVRPAYQRCLQPRRGVHYAVSCRAKHSYRAVKGVVLHGSYPGDRALARKAQRTCPRAAGRRWYATWPSAESWRSGFHVLVCHRRTRR